MTDIKAFYDSLAVDYHLMFRDWWTSATRQGEVLDRLLRAHGLAAGATLLDCTCGIGTQALPLAQRGYVVTGTDLSPEAVEQARREADERGIDIRLGTADVRTLTVPTPFDVALSGDNSLPHLRSDADMHAALTSIRACLRPGGVFLATVRDYDVLAGERVTGVPAMTFDDGDGRRIVGQTWTWTGDMSTVTFDLFILTQQEHGWQATVRTTTYRAWRRKELTAALSAAGFDDITWHEPDEHGYHQPLVTARSPEHATTR
jgi:glycine/sarcosine N-methyltransferase